MSFTLGPDGTPIRKRDLSDWSVDEDSKITAMFCDTESGNIYVAKKEPLQMNPTMSGPGIRTGFYEQLPATIKTFPDLTKITIVEQGIHLKVVIRSSTSELSQRYIEGNLDMIESKTISKNALTKWTSAPSGVYVSSEPNMDTTSRVSISLYNAEKEHVREIWSGQSSFPINGLCVRKGALYYTHESEVRMIDPAGNPYRVAGTIYVKDNGQNYSSVRLEEPTAFARTFPLGNPYGIVYDTTTDLIFFTDVEQAAVYSLNVDTGILAKISTGSVDIVSQIDDSERPSTDCYIQDPAGIACAADGTIYVSAVTSGQIYKFRKAYDSTGALQYFISIFAGYNSQAATLASEDDRPGKYARIQNPLHLAVDKQMNVYYFEQGSNRIRYIQPDIYRTYFKGRTGAFNYWPLQVIVNNSPEGYTKEEPVGSNSINAAAISFEFYANHLAADEEGNVYFCDPKYGTLNRVTPNNQIQVIATGLPNLYSLTIINNTDIWACTLDTTTTTTNSILYRIPFIQNPSWPIEPDVTIRLSTRIECMASHPRGSLFLAGKTDGNLYTYDIVNDTLLLKSVEMNIVSMCTGMNNSMLYVSTDLIPSSPSSFNTKSYNIYAYPINMGGTIPIRKFTFTNAWFPSSVSTYNFWNFEFTQNLSTLMNVQFTFVPYIITNTITIKSRLAGANWKSVIDFPMSDLGVTRTNNSLITIIYNGRTFKITSNITKNIVIYIPSSDFNSSINVRDISLVGYWSLDNRLTRPIVTDTETIISVLELGTPIHIAGNSTNVYGENVLTDTTTLTGHILINPRGLAYNSAENCLYVTCGLNDQTTPKFVRRIDLSADGRSGIFATTLIGSMRPGFPLSGASYSSVSLMYPTGIVCTLQGSIYFIDTMYLTNIVQATSVLVRVPNIFFLKPDLVYAFAGSGIPGTTIPTDGTLTQRVSLSTINGMTLDRDGNFYFTTNWNTIHKVDALTYKITRIAGTGANPGSSARQNGINATLAPLDTPRGLVYSRSGILYFTEGNFIRYLEMGAAGTYMIQTLVANIDLGITPGNATLWIDSIRNVLYVSIKNNFRIYSIDTFKRATLLTNMSSLGTSTSDIHSLCKYENHLYVCVPHLNTIYRVDLRNSNTTGNFTNYISPSGGIITDVGVVSPYGIVVDKNGTLYVSMRGRHTIKRYSIVNTSPIFDEGKPYIGIDGQQSYGDGEAISGIIDGVKRENSRLHSPTLLTLDVYNRLFFVDQGKNRICCMATGVDLDTKGVATKFIRVESAGPGRTFTISRFDIYTLQQKVYDAIANTTPNADRIAQQALRSVDIQLNKTDTTSVTITYINIKVTTADSLDSKVYLYNEFREIMAVQTITAEALKPDGQNLIFIESWSQENVPAIRNELMDITRGIKNVASVGLTDVNNTISQFIVVTATSDDKIETFIQKADAARQTTNENKTITPTLIEYKSSNNASPYNLEVLCVFLMRRPGSRSNQLDSLGIDYPVQVILKDAAGTTLKHKNLVIASPNNSKYEVIDFRLNSELYSTLSMDAIYEAVFGVKRVRYVRIFFSETGSTSVTATTNVKIRNICVVSAENGKNVAFGKPVYDSAGNSYSTLTDESNTPLTTTSETIAITWLEVDLQYPAIIDRIMINRADDDTMEYFTQGYTERRELVSSFPTSAENPFSQKTSVVYVSGSGYNATAGRNRYLNITRSGMNYFTQITAITSGPREGTFSGKTCSQKSYSMNVGGFAPFAYFCVEILNNFVMIESRLQIQKIFAYSSQTSTTDTMITGNVILRSSTPDNITLNSPEKALTDDPSFNSTTSITDDSIFITADRTNNAYWEATYNTPTYLKKFTLKQDPNDPAAKVRMFGINLRHYNQKRRLLGRYGARGNYDTEDFTYSQSPLNTYQIPIFTFRRGVSGVRYVRMINPPTITPNHIQVSQLAVYDTTGTLISLNRPVTTANTPPTIWNNINNNKDWITQGHLYPSMYTMYASQMSTTDWIQIDLGADFTGEIESVVYYNRSGSLSSTLDQQIGDDLTSRSNQQVIQLLRADQTEIASRTLKGGLLRESLDFRPEAGTQIQYVRARYVRIENPGPITSGTYTPTTMTFSSLKVNDIYGINVACGKSVDARNYSASDDGGGGESVDGRYGPIKSDTSSYTIGAIPGSYWEIDLGEDISIRSIEIQMAEPLKFKNTPLNFYDEDRSLIAQYFMNPTSTLYEFNILDATNPIFKDVRTREIRFVQILGNRGASINNLRIGQLIILDKNGINIALGKPTYSSPVVFDSASSKYRSSYNAINGRCNNRFESTSVGISETNSGHAYLEVDLGGTYNVCAIILRDFRNVRAVRTFGDIKINTEGREVQSNEMNIDSQQDGAECKIVAYSPTNPTNPTNATDIVPTPRTGIGKKARYVRLRQPPIPIATNRGENGIALSQLLVIDAVGRNVALGKPVQAYPSQSSLLNNIISGFYDSDRWSWENSKYNLTGQTCTNSIWNNPSNGICGNSYISDANWNTSSWNTSLDTSWVEVDLGAEYWITEIIIHDIVGNTYQQANYDVIMRDTYYNMVYYGQGVITAASRSLNILHKRNTNSEKFCPQGSRRGDGTGGTASNKCYVDCPVGDSMVNDTGSNTNNLNCYTTCPKVGGLDVLPVTDPTNSNIYSLCPVCPANSSYDRSWNKCVTDCLSNYEPRENSTGGKFCSRYCVMDPSGNPMTWADPVTKTECKTANFPDTGGQTRVIVDSNAIQTMSRADSIQFMSNSPYGTAIIKSKDVYTNYWKNARTNVIDYRKMGEYQTSGRARLLFQYFYDNTSNLRSNTQFTGIMNRISTNLTTSNRPTTTKQEVAMITFTTNPTEGYRYINTQGTQRRYQIYLDWTGGDTTNRFYVVDSTNPVYVYGRSYSQSIHLGNTRVSNAIFPLPENPFDQGSCPPGYTSITNPPDPAKPCKQNRPADTTEIGTNYVRNCPSGYTTISDTQCRMDCTGNFEVHDINKCRTLPPGGGYVMTEAPTDEQKRWILCSGTDPNGVPYRYENGASKYVFNSVCFKTRYPSVPATDNPLGFDPFDIGLWRWLMANGPAWTSQWLEFNKNNTRYPEPGCSDQCVSAFPPNGSRTDMRPFMVHDFSSLYGEWRRWPTFWAWCSEQKFREVNGNSLSDSGADGENNGWNNKFWPVRNIYRPSGPQNTFETLRANGFARQIYTTSPTDIQNIRYISREISNRVSNPILYEPRA